MKNYSVWFSFLTEDTSEIYNKIIRTDARDSEEALSNAMGELTSHDKKRITQVNIAYLN